MPEQAIANILGANKVIGYRNVMRVWDLEIPEIVPFIGYTDEAILEACAEENRHGADWRLVWINGFSLRQMEEMRYEKQPCFDSSYAWWSRSAEDSWATQTITPRYRLLDFKGYFANMIWKRQNEEIAKRGEGIKRADGQAVTEAVFSIYMVSNKKQRLLQDWYHWSSLPSDDGCYVNVGCFNGDGFSVHYCWDDRPSLSQRVVLSR